MSMYPLVHTWARDRLSGSDEEQTWGVECVGNSGVDTMVLPDGRVPLTPDFASDPAATQVATSDIASEISDTGALIIDLLHNCRGHPDMMAMEL